MSWTTGARSRGGTSFRCSMYAVAGQLDAMTWMPYSGTYARISEMRPTDGKVHVTPLDSMPLLVATPDRFMQKQQNPFNHSSSSYKDGSRGSWHAGVAMLRRQNAIKRSALAHQTDPAR